MKLFGVYDVKADHFSKPFFDESTANAIRGFEVVCNQDGTPFNQFPDDFRLYELGSFDRQTGEFVGTKLDLGAARSLLRNKS